VKYVEYLNEHLFQYWNMYF